MGRTGRLIATAQREIESIANIFELIRTTMEGDELQNARKRALGVLKARLPTEEDEESPRIILHRLLGRATMLRSGELAGKLIHTAQEVRHVTKKIAQKADNIRRRRERFAERERTYGNNEHDAA